MMEQKERIAKYSFTLFKVNGIRSVSMAEIASNLGISKRTLYELFENKEDLLIYSVDYFSKERLQLANKVISESDNIIEAYLKMLDQDQDINGNWNVKFFDDIEKYYHMTGAFLKRLENEGIQYMSSFISDGIEKGLFRDNLNKAVYAFLLIDLGQSYIRAMKLSALPFSLKDLSYEMNLNAIRGMCTAKGLEIIDNYFENNNNK